MKVSVRSKQKIMPVAPARKRVKDQVSKLDREAERLSSELNHRAASLSTDERLRRHEVLKRIAASIPDEGGEK
jgi:hypothetical protein